MRHTEFWRRMETVFGAAYARSWAADMALAELDGRTVAQALEQGVPAKQVWQVVCLHAEVPAALH